MSDIEVKSQDIIKYSNANRFTRDSMDKSDNQLNKVVIFTIKLILIGLTGIYLLYETIELIKLYGDHNTFVSVYYERKEFNQIPSFTICLPTIIDRNKLLDKYPDLIYKLNETNSEGKRNNIIVEYLDLVLDSMAWTGLTIQEYEAFNCSLNYWSIKSNKFSIGADERKAINCREVVKPIESYSNTKTKCFTYFSQLNADKHFKGMSHQKHIFSIINKHNYYSVTNCFKYKNAYINNSAIIQIHP